MYLKINKFLLSHEYLNMSKVPGFYQFFYSSDLEVRLLKSPRAPETPPLDHEPLLSLWYSPLGAVGGRQPSCADSVGARRSGK